jgi:hypothetical protein
MKKQLKTALKEIKPKMTTSIMTTLWKAAMTSMRMLQDGKPKSMRRKP